MIPIAGDQVTNDIAMALRTPTQHAEEIKIRYACALTQLAGPDETIKVPSVGDRPPRDLSRQSLAEVVEPRYDELFTLIQSELRRSGYEELIPAGVVLTGGTSKMEGAVELAEEIFHMPVRVGAPQYARGLHDIIRNPVYATAIGLLLYGAEASIEDERNNQRGSLGNELYRSGKGLVRATFLDHRKTVFSRALCFGAFFKKGSKRCLN